MQDKDKKYLEQLGKRIYKLRTERKLTLESVCYKNSIEPSTLNRIENAQVEPKYSTLLKIAKAFNMTISELLDF